MTLPEHASNIIDYQYLKRFSVASKLVYREIRRLLRKLGGGPVRGAGVT